MKTESDLIFRFYSKPNVKNRITIVGKQVKNLVHISVARCDDNDDAFEKKEGRRYAETERLNVGDYFMTITLHAGKKLSTKRFVNIARAVDVLIQNDPRILTRKESPKKEK